MNIIQWLEEWFYAQCTDDWAHAYGVKIETLDNPGWAVAIDLTETELENRSFDRYEMDNGESDWMVCKVENNCFKGFGDLSKLESILFCFKNWVEN